MGAEAWTATRSRAATAVRAAVLLLCFGLLGLVALLPPVLRRRARTVAACSTCRRRNRVGRVAVTAFALLLCVGAGARFAVHLRPPVLCDSRISASGRVTPEPLLPVATSGSPGWETLRSAVVAPASGLALLATSAVGMRHCSGPPLLVAFWWPSHADGGSMVGDLFISRTTGADAPGGIFQEGVGTGARSTDAPYGPDLPIDRASEQRLALHEERHLNQWGIATLLGGPLAFPAAYLADYLVFPDGRSHFERAASLQDGEYRIPPDFGPDVRWGPVLVLGLVAAALLRTRVRRALRALRLLPAPGPAAVPGRCSLHAARRPRTAVGGPSATGVSRTSGDRPAGSR